MNTYDEVIEHAQAHALTGLETLDFHGSRVDKASRCKVVLLTFDDGRQFRVSKANMRRLATHNFRTADGATVNGDTGLGERAHRVVNDSTGEEGAK